MNVYICANTKNRGILKSTMTETGNKQNTMTEETGTEEISPMWGYLSIFTCFYFLALGVVIECGIFSLMSIILCLSILIILFISMICFESVMNNHRPTRTGLIGKVIEFFRYVFALLFAIFLVWGALYSFSLTTRIGNRD